MRRDGLDGRRIDRHRQRIHVFATNSSAVLLHLVSASGATFDCSNTIIERAVLTAGHCVLDAASARVALGTGVEVSVTAMAAAPAYVADPNSLDDVAVMLVGQDSPRQPMPLLFSRAACRRASRHRGLGRRGLCLVTRDMSPGDPGECGLL